MKYMAKASCGPLNAPRWGFTSTKNGKLDACVFYARFAAKKFLDLMIGEDEVEWIDDDTLRTESDVRIYANSTKKKNTLRAIFDHKLTYNENRYHTLNEDHEKRAAIIKSNDHAKPFVEGSSITTRKRRSRKGMVLIRTIAEELGMTPREARGILRGKMRKPEQGWAWRTTEEVIKIKNLILSSVRTVKVDFSETT